MGTNPAGGKARLEQLAQWYEKSWAQAVASLREGLDETFTINGTGRPGKLRRSLATTNLIESPGAGPQGRKELAGGASPRLARPKR